jgi:DNA-binding LacI/PurR family transcriptional regulator
VAERKVNATSTQVAKLAGVSQSAVSRAFTPGASIAESTRRKVLQAARKLGYQPNAIARSLSTKRSKIIGIVIANVTTNPFYPEVLEALNRKFQQRGQKVMLFVVSRDQNLDDILPQLLEYRVDGILLTAATLSSEMAYECARLGVPVTLFNRTIPDVSASSFCCDNLEGGRMAARLLLESGHKNIAFIAGNRDTSTSIDREQGFREEMARKGLEPLVEIGNFSYEGAFAATTALMKQSAPPDGLFCANDIMAIGAMDALRYGEDKKVPEEVSVIGFDDIPMAGWPSYRLTTIRQPIGRMINAAVEDLMSRINEEGLLTKQELMAGDLVVRSSAKLPVGLDKGWVISTSEQHH